MAGRFVPPDHSRGDADTIGGYAAVHARPAAFEGSDGYSYSVELATDETGDPARPVGAYLLFLRWRRIGAQGVEGHLESDFLAWGERDADALAAIGRLRLNEVKRVLEALLRERSEQAAGRRWWDAMRDAPDGDEDGADGDRA